MFNVFAAQCLVPPTNNSRALLDQNLCTPWWRDIGWVHTCTHVCRRVRHAATNRGWVCVYNPNPLATGRVAYDLQHVDSRDLGANHPVGMPEVLRLIMPTTDRLVLLSRILPTSISATSPSQEQIRIGLLSASPSQRSTGISKRA
jgi:hypothetical protein